MADPCVQLAQRLAANDKKSRDRALRRLRNYLRERSGRPEGGFSVEDLCKVWKGLFYCLWMQDKPMLQEELARSMAQLVHMLQSRDSRNLFLRAFWQTLNREWNGIDRLRLDKFYSLMRFVLHQSAVLLKRADWEQSAVDEFLALLVEEVLKPEAPHGVQHHLIDIYLEELAKVGSAELPADMNLKLIQPFCKIAAKTKDLTLQQSIVSGIFQAILDQAPFAIEDLMKEIGHIPTDQDPNHDGAAEEEAGPRCAEEAGPVLQFDYQAISDKLFTFASQRNVPTRNRKSLYYLVKRFKNLAEGFLPQGGFPEKVSTDEDDEEFSSGRFHKQEKKLQERLLVSQGIAPEHKKKSKRARASAAPEASSPPPAKKKRKKGPRPAQQETLQSQHNGTAETPLTTEATSRAAATHQSHAVPSDVKESDPAPSAKLRLRRRRSSLIRLGLSVLPLRGALLWRRAVGRRRQLISNKPASPPVSPSHTPPPAAVTPPSGKVTASQDFITFRKSGPPRPLYVKSSKSRGRSPPARMASQRKSPSASTRT